MMQTLIIALVKRLMGWLVGVPFFNAVYHFVSYFDGMVDLDGDGKKGRVLDELGKAGWIFGKRQFNRALEAALIIVEQEKGIKKPTPQQEKGNGV